MGLEETDQLGPLGPVTRQCLELSIVQRALLGTDAEVDDLVHEPAVPEQRPVVRPVDRLFLVQCVADVTPLLGTGQQHGRLRVTEVRVVPRHVVIGEPVPRIDRYIADGREALVEQQPVREPVLKLDLLSAVGDQEEDAIGGAVRRGGQLHEPFHEGRGLARARPPEGDHWTGAMLDQSPLGVVEPEAGWGRGGRSVHGANLAWGCDRSATEIALQQSAPFAKINHSSYS